MVTISFNSLSGLDAAVVSLEKTASREEVEQLLFSIKKKIGQATDRIFLHFSGTISISGKREILLGSAQSIMDLWAKHFEHCVDRDYKHYSGQHFSSLKKLTGECGLKIRFLSEAGVRSWGLPRKSQYSDTSLAHCREIPHLKGKSIVRIARNGKVMLMNGEKGFPSKRARKMINKIREKNKSLVTRIVEHNKLVKVTGKIDDSFKEKLKAILRAYEEYLNASPDQKKQALVKCEELVEQYDLILEGFSYADHRGKKLELQIMSSDSFKQVSTAIEEGSVPDTFLIPAIAEQIQRHCSGGFTRTREWGEGRSKNVHHLEESTEEEKSFKTSRTS